MAWADLSDTEKEQVQTYDRLLRGAIGEFAKVLYKINVANTYNDSTVGALLTIIGSDEIPSDSGLAGIEMKTGTQMAAINTQLEALITDNYSAADQQNYVEFAGPTNVIP